MESIKINFHMHSSHSDGVYAPNELIKKLKEANVEYASLTDHDRYSGVAEFNELATVNGITAINGIEISTTYSNNMICNKVFSELSIHILGLDYDLIRLEQEFENFRKIKTSLLKDFLKEINKDGYRIDSSLLRHNELTVTQVAESLIDGDIYKSTNDVYNVIFSKYRHYKFNSKSIEDVVRTIHNANGLAILAHPYEVLDLVNGSYQKVELTNKEVRSLVMALNSYGIDGIEVNYANYSKEKKNFLNDLANEMILIKSGGSDFHGKFENEKMFSVVDSESIKSIIKREKDEEWED